MSDASPGGEGRLTRHRRAGLTFDVRDEGPIDGTPVLLLHGFPETSSTWDRVVPLLHEAGLRTLALDQRGYSLGARPRRRRDYRLPLLVEDAASVLRRVGGVHVVGHDWGAVVAWMLAAHRPELVRSLTAFSVPHPAAYLRAMVTTRQAAKSWYLAAFQVRGLAERVSGPGGRLERQLARTGMDDDDLARFRREIVEGGRLRGGLMYYRALAMAGPGYVREPVRRPTTMAWSRGDDAIDRRAAERAGRWVVTRTPDDYRWVELPGTHWIPSQDPAACAATILDRVGVRP